MVPILSLKLLKSTQGHQPFSEEGGNSCFCFMKVSIRYGHFRGKSPKSFLYLYSSDTIQHSPEQVFTTLRTYDLYSSKGGVGYRRQDCWEPLMFMFQIKNKNQTEDEIFSLFLIFYVTNKPGPLHLRTGMFSPLFLSWNLSRLLNFLLSKKLFELLKSNLFQAFLDSCHLTQRVYFFSRYFSALTLKRPLFEMLVKLYHYISVTTSDDFLC